jgi:hypothetical protein
MSLLAGIVVVGFAIFLIGLAGVVFVKPPLAERFLGMSLRLLKFTGGGSVDDYAICRSS